MSLWFWRNENFPTRFLVGQWVSSSQIYLCQNIILWRQQKSIYLVFILLNVAWIGARFEVVRRGECLCALAGILIPASAQRHSLPDNNAQQLCAVKTALRFFRWVSLYILCVSKSLLDPSVETLGHECNSIELCVHLNINRAASETLRFKHGCVANTVHSCQQYCSGS